MGDEAYLKNRKTLAARYAKAREMRKLPVKLTTGGTIRLSPGDHSELIKAVIEEFAPRYVPGGILIYAGETGEKEERAALILVARQPSHGLRRLAASD